MLETGFFRDLPDRKIRLFQQFACGFQPVLKTIAPRWNLKLFREKIPQVGGTVSRMRGKFLPVDGWIHLFELVADNENFFGEGELLFRFPALFQVQAQC